MNESNNNHETANDTKPVLSEVADKYPSICYACRSARKPAANENRDKGYVGCAEFTRNGHYYFVGEAKELAEGWVDLKARIFGEKSGIITNLQLMTLEVKKCSSFETES